MLSCHLFFNTGTLGDGDNEKYLIKATFTDPVDIIVNVCHRVAETSGSSSGVTMLQVKPELTVGIDKYYCTFTNRQKGQN